MVNKVFYEDGILAIGAVDIWLVVVTPILMALMILHVVYNVLG